VGVGVTRTVLVGGLAVTITVITVVTGFGEGMTYTVEVPGRGTSCVTLVMTRAVRLVVAGSGPGRTVSLVGMGSGPRTEDCGLEEDTGLGSVTTEVATDGKAGITTAEVGAAGAVFSRS